jgi:hypothetical protein
MMVLSRPLPVAFRDESDVIAPRTRSDLEAVDQILRDWLGDDDLTIFCGEWGNGSLMELLPRGKATLTHQHYAGEFAGLRDLRLEDSGHHVHLDLAKLCRACYVVAPSVCYGYRPSLQLRLAMKGSDPMREYGLGLSLHPYQGAGLRVNAAERYFARVATHLAAYPEVVSFTCLSSAASTETEPAWSFIDALLARDLRLAHLRSAVASAFRVAA